MDEIISRTERRGIRVIEIQKGKKIGEIGDILFDNHNGIIKGVMVFLKHWIKKRSILTNERIVTTSRYSLLAYDSIDTTNLGDKIIQGRDLIGVKLIREDGYEVGKVSDIFINRKNWAIVGYELSIGVIDDFVHGRSLLPYTIPYGSDNNALVVTNYQYENIRYYADAGIKNIFFNTIK